MKRWSTIEKSILAAAFSDKTLSIYRRTKNTKEAFEECSEKYCGGDMRYKDIHPRTFEAIRSKARRLGFCLIKCFVRKRKEKM
jgi:hypothetical protein